MDFLTLLGLIIALAAILIGQILEGGKPDTLVNFPAFLIVFGGTFGAVMVESPFRIFVKALKILPWSFFPPKVNVEEEVERITMWSNIARKEGLLSLESLLDDEENEFYKKGLQLLIDGNEPSSIRKILETELEQDIASYYQASRLYESMGGYCPTIGIIGAVMGLIHVMSNLSDPEKLGSGIAVAFVATIYGVGLANILFLPLSTKLKNAVTHKFKKEEAFIEGLIGIADGENPKLIEYKLLGFFENR